MSPRRTALAAAPPEDPVAGVLRRQDALERNDELRALAMQRIEIKADQILQALGDEGEDRYGRPIGTGIVGRLMRLELRVERRFGLYDGLRRYAAGVAAGVAVAGAALWWVISDRIGSLLK